MNSILWMDYESRSLLNVKYAGLDRYAKHTSTQPLIMAYAFDDEEPSLWRIYKGEPIPERLKQGMLNPQVLKGAWNYNFEKDITKFKIGIDIPQDQWIDPSVQCAYMALPVNLEKVGHALQLDISIQKTMSKGPKGLVNTFSKTSKALKKMIKANDPRLFMGNDGEMVWFKDWDSHPTQWTEFEEYCLQDVRAERAIYHELQTYNCSLPDSEQEIWLLDQRMNERGIWIDRQYVENAKKLAEEEVNEILSEIKTHTGVENPNSRDQVLEWLQARGYQDESLDKEAIENGIKQASFWKMSPLAVTILELKKRLGGSAYKKLESILDRVGPDGRLRGQFLYHGAHTGRWAGRGVQLQNLYKAIKTVSQFLNRYVSGIRLGKKIYSRNTKMQLVAGTIRAAFAATPGNKLIVGDLAQIESRVLAVLAQCKTMMDAYAQGRDLYVEFMAWFLSKPMSEVTSEERARGKIVILGSGFQMGWEKFMDYAATFGITLTEKEAKDAIYGFRDKYEEITTLWSDYNNAVIQAVKLGICVYVKGIVFDGRNPRMLKIKLPSGRYLHYLSPRVTVEETSWGEMREGVTYVSWGKKGRAINRLYGGLITENIVQAVARDILVNGMFEAEKMGFIVLMTIHDEIVCEILKSSGLGLDDLLKCMKKIPVWGEGMGFVLNAEGYESLYYRK